MRLTLARFTTYRQIRHYTVSLAYTKYPAPEPTTNSPIVVCHGLFGSKQNWRTLSKTMSSLLARDVYAVDLRNHGDSPHCERHTYGAMASDLERFVSEHDLKHPILLGHSMGGKVVMTTALREPSLPSKLVVVDIAPLTMPLSNDFAAYAKAMEEIDNANVKKQSQADAILAETEPDLGVRQFLLTNLKRQPDGIYRFRIPYKILGKTLNHMGAFRAEESEQGKRFLGPGHYDKPTLFITGGNSSYRKPFIEHPDRIKAQFPNSQVTVVEGTGHWVHAEKPAEFLRLVEAFVGKADKK